MTARRTCRTALPAALVGAAVLLPAGAAAAAEPDQAGWWNRASAGGQALPAPTATPGDLRVSAVGPNETTAYAAVLYTTLGSTSATLDLEIRSSTGTPAVAACPTADTAWPEGDNQPYDKAPKYDCELGSAFGEVAEDGKTVSFLLDASTQTLPGVWSLALVPQPGSTSGPFSIDFVKPGPAAFVAEEPEVQESETGTAFDPGTTTTGTEAGSGEALLPGGFEAPPEVQTGSVEMPPLLAGEDAASLPQAAAPPPAVAGGPASSAGAPTLVATPAGVVEDLGSGRRLLALLVLAGGSAAVGYAAGQQRPAPRLLGGRARLGTPAVVGGAPVPVALEEDRPRGIGRFAKLRDAAPRRLR